MDTLFLIAYLILPLLTLWRSRSVSWTLLTLVSSVSLVGAAITFSVDHLFLWTRPGMQWALLVALAVPAVLAFVRRPAVDSPRRYQALAILVPVALLTAFFFVMMTFWTDVPAYETPVGFLMGHALAEDNAKWLDFTAAYAAGGPIDQFVPMGGPLQLILVFVGTLMGAVSQWVFGGYNQVMVAANTVVYAQFLMVAIAPLALAPLVGERLRRPIPADANSGSGWVRVPWPAIWLGALVLVITNLMLTAYGHLTLQFTVLLATFWVTTFLIGTRTRFAFVLSSMAVVIGMTVWLPMNAIAGIVLLGWFAYLVARLVSAERTRDDAISLVLVVLVAIAVWEPMRSSLEFVLTSTPSAAGAVLASMGGGVHAAAVALAPVPLVGGVLAGLTESTLFADGGGTEVATAIQSILAVAAVVAVAIVVGRRRLGRAGYVRLVPIALLAGFALVLNTLDQWATGSAPHYGSQKFTFMVTIVVIASCVPIALLVLDPAVTGMTLTRWAALGGVVFLLVVDSLLVRSIAAARPTQWSPPVPFDNPRSYWWPAEVNGTADQPISGNPVGCVYLPQGAKGPSAILDSQLSDPQRVYSCTRLLAGLAGADASAQPLVDWLRREWTTNQRAWDGVHGYLAGMPDSALDKPVILLDDGSNVIGLESMRSLVNRYPADVWTR